MSFYWQINLSLLSELKLGSTVPNKKEHKNRNICLINFTKLFSIQQNINWIFNR